jgi:hypothetical protein
MTHEELIEFIDRMHPSGKFKFRLENGTLIMKGKGSFAITEFDEICSNLEIRTIGNVVFHEIKLISENVIIGNDGGFWIGMGDFPKLSKGVRFENTGQIGNLSMRYMDAFSIRGIKRRDVINTFVKQIYG